MTTDCVSKVRRKRTGADWPGKSGNGWLRRVGREFGQECFHERVVPSGGPGIRQEQPSRNRCRGVKSTCSSN